MKFIVFFAALFASLAAAAPTKRADALPLMYNGMNVTFNYDGIILMSPDAQFGLVLTTADAPDPTNLFYPPVEGPLVIGFDDEDLIDATYVLQYPFFNPGHPYTVQLLEYNTTSFDVVTPNLREQSFIWVDRPGQSD